MESKHGDQGCHFDIDGTLVDSVDLHARAWQEAFKKFGKEIPFAEVRRQIGKGGDQLLPVFFSKKELDEFGEEMEEYRGELFKKEYMSRVKAFPKVRELFERIKADGKKIALASSAKKDELSTYKNSRALTICSKAKPLRTTWRNQNRTRTSSRRARELGER